MPTAQRRSIDVNEDDTQSLLVACAPPTDLGCQIQPGGTQIQHSSISSRGDAALPNQHHDIVSSLLPVQDSRERKKRGGQRGKRSDSKKWCNLVRRDRTSRRGSSAGSATTKSLVPALGHPTPIPRAALKSNHAPPVQSAAALTPPINSRSSSSFKSIDQPDRTPPVLTPTPIRNSNAIIQRKRKGLCDGVYDGCFGSALNFAGRFMLNTGHKLIKMAMEPDAGIASFAKSTLAKSRSLFLPYYGMKMERTEDAKDGYRFFSEDCTCSAKEGRYPICATCSKSKDNLKHYVSRSYQPNVKQPGRSSPIECIVNNPTKARLEIESLRKANRELRKQRAKDVFSRELNQHGVHLDKKSLCRTSLAIEVMDETITTALKEGNAEEELDLWELHRAHINQVWKNGGRSRHKKAPVHPTVLNWAIAFLAKTSVSVYKEVANIMQLPDISYIYRKTNELVSTTADRGYSLNLQTIRTMGERANKDQWSENARKGVLAQDSCSLSAGIEHDHVSNRLIGGDETHRLGNLSNMFHLMAQQVRDVPSEESNEDEGDAIDKVSDLCISNYFPFIKSHTPRTIHIHALSLRTQYLMSYD